MDIISYDYNNFINNLFLDSFSKNLSDSISSFNSSGDVFNYLNFSSSLDSSLCDIAKSTLVFTLESLDAAFKASSERKSKYYVKSTHPRSILTIFGEITFTRSFYKSKVNGSNFCYVDRLLGLHKYDYFDPYIKSLVLHYASDNSYSKTASIINDSIGSRLKLDSPFPFLSRQSVRNIIMNSLIAKPLLSPLPTPDTIFILADEKWIHTQRNNHDDIMQKSIVIFDGISSCNSRRSLNNKMIFAGHDDSLITNALSYLDTVYDISLINTIHVMGDGASWIKSLPHEFKLSSSVNVTFSLDKFHFKQAIHHIAQDENIEYYLANYVIHDNKDAFISCCDEIISSSPLRSEVINQKKDYILNNWTFIQNIYNLHLTCPMESQISHNLAAFFTSRPKAYSPSSIPFLSNLRLLFKNNFNIKHLFFQNFNSSSVIDPYDSRISLPLFEKSPTTSLPKKFHYFD